MFYIGMIALAIIIILIFIFGEVISGVPNTKSSEKPTNKKAKRGNFTEELQGKSSGSFKFKHGGKTYLLKTSDTLILETLKGGIGKKFAITYEEKEVSSSRGTISGKILGAKKV